MIQYIIIAAVGIIGVAGLATAVRSIHRAHSRIAARHDEMFERVDTALQRGAHIACNPVPMPSPGRAAAQPSIANRIEVLCPKAGDMLVVQIDRTLTVQQRDSIRQSIAPYMPDGVKLVVLDAPISVKHVMAPTP